MPLYRFAENKISYQVRQAIFPTERELQRLFEQNLEALLGVRFIASEFTTGERQRGRIDTLGLDQDNSPTIIEYKKSNKENVINQGLFYLDWLVDHKGDFTLAAQKALDPNVVIDWSHPRLILVAESFNIYDTYAINRIGANIELWTYIKYGEDLLHIDPIYTSIGTNNKNPNPVKTDDGPDGGGVVLPITYSVSDHTDDKPEVIVQLFTTVQERIFQFAGENEIFEKANKHYISYKHGKNFAEVHLQSTGLKIWLDIPFDDLTDPKKIARDMSKLGHYGTGNVELKLAPTDDLEYVIDLIHQSYQATV